MDTNVTPVEQDDSAAIPLIEVGDLVLGYDPLNPGAGAGASNKHAQPVANTLLWLKRRIGVAGTWDLSPLAAACEPDNAYLQEATWTKTDDNNYEMTPVAGAQQFKDVGGDIVSLLTTNTWGRIATPNAGGNLGVIGMAFTNDGATLSDALTTLFGGTPTGTCTVGAMVFLDVSGAFGGVGTMQLKTTGVGFPSASTPFTTTFTPGTSDVHIGVRSDGSVLTVSVDNGVDPVEELASAAGFAALFTGNLARPMVGMYFTTGTPTFPDGTMNFDFSDTSGGRAGLATYTQAALPSGAADGKRYLVSGAGAYNGRAAAVGDIVELHTATTLMQVYPATPMTSALVDAAIAAYLGTNPPVSLLMEAKIRGIVLDFANEPQLGWPRAAVRGDVCVVGNAPAGAWSAFTAYNLAVYDGAAWVEYTRADFRECALVCDTDVLGNNGHVYFPANIANTAMLPMLDGIQTIGTANVSMINLLNNDIIVIGNTGGGLQVNNFETTSAASFTVEVGRAAASRTTVTVGPAVTMNFSFTGGAHFVRHHAAVYNNTGAPLDLTVTYYADNPVTIAAGDVAYFTIYNVSGLTPVVYHWGVGVDATARAGLAQKLNVVRSAADLPTAVGGYHTLAAGVYLFESMVDLGSNALKIVDDDTALIGHGINAGAKSTAMPVAVDFDIPALIEGMTLWASSGGWPGVLAQATGVTTNGDVTIRRCTVKADAIVQFDRTANLTVHDCVHTHTGTAGVPNNNITVSSSRNVGRVSICGNVLRNGSGSAITLGNTTPTGNIEIFDNEHTSTGGAYFIDNTNLVLSSTAQLRIARNRTNVVNPFSDNSPPVHLMNEVECVDNVGIKDSIAVGHMHMDNNATATTIAVAGTYYKAAGTTSGAVENRFTHSANRLTYTGSKTQQFEVNVAVTLVSASNNQRVGVMIAKNGNPVTGSKMRGKVLASGDPTNLFCTDVIELGTNDYLEVFITNETGTNSITVEDLQMTVGGTR